MPQWHLGILVSLLVSWFLLTNKLPRSATYRMKYARSLHLFVGLFAIHMLCVCVRMVSWKTKVNLLETIRYNMCMVYVHMLWMWGNTYWHISSNIVMVNTPSCTGDEDASTLTHTSTHFFGVVARLSAIEWVILPVHLRFLLQAMSWVNCGLSALFAKCTAETNDVLLEFLTIFIVNNSSKFYVFDLNTWS